MKKDLVFQMAYVLKDMVSAVSVRLVFFSLLFFREPNVLVFSVEIGCGGLSNENHTLFTSNNSKLGACNANICKKDADVVQLRLDFTTFVLLDSSVPDTEKFVMGATDQDFDAPSTIDGQCETDSFIVTSVDGIGRSPVLCGVNTGEHSKF